MAANEQPKLVPKPAPKAGDDTKDESSKEFDPFQKLKQALGIASKAREQTTKVLDALDDGTQHGENSFFQFLCVWIGFLFVLAVVGIARASDWMVNPVYSAINQSVPEAKWWIIVAVLIVITITSAFISHAHTRKTYARLLIVGAKWGIAAIFIVAVAPMIFVVGDLVSYLIDKV